MGIKYVKKEKLGFENGYITRKGDVVAIDPVVIEQLNHLELVCQQFTYIEEQPKAVPEPSLEGFEFKSTIDRPRLTTLTPNLDKEYERAKKLMAEIDSISETKEINEAFERYDALIQWCKDEKVMVTTNPTHLPARIDTHSLGNPLKLTDQKIYDIIIYIAGGGVRINTEDTEDTEND